MSLRPTLTKPLYERSFVTARLDRELQKFRDRPELKSSKLTDIGGYRDPHAVAERLVTELCSLPWQYSLILRLPDELCSALLTDASTELNDGARLIRRDENFKQQFPGLGVIGIEAAGYLQIYAPGLLANTGSRFLCGMPFPLYGHFVVLVLGSVSFGSDRSYHLHPFKDLFSYISNDLINPGNLNAG